MKNVKNLYFEIFEHPEKLSKLFVTFEMEKSET